MGPGGKPMKQAVADRSPRNMGSDTVQTTVKKVLEGGAPRGKQRKRDFAFKGGGRNLHYDAVGSGRLEVKGGAIKKGGYLGRGGAI